MKSLITIVPAESAEGRPLMAQGTKVLLQDGTELEGVTRIELIAEVNALWHARIDCYARVAVLPSVLAEVVTRPNLAWWRRALLRMAGVILDVTDLKASARMFEKP